MLKRIFMLIFMSSISLSLYANKTSDDFSKLKEYAKSLSAAPLNALNQFNPEKTFENYNANPKEKGYYQSVETEKVDLDKLSAQALADDAGGKAVVENFGQHKFEINENNAAIKQAKLIEEESYAITHGTSNENINCDEKAPICETKTHQERCQRSVTLPDKQCRKKLEISVKRETISHHVDAVLSIPRKWTGRISINLFSGMVSGGFGGSISGPVKLTRACENFNALIHSIRSLGIESSKIRIVSLPSCGNGGVLSFYIPEEFKEFYYVQIALRVDASSVPYIADEHWEDNCDMGGENSLCRKIEEQCINPNSSRIIEGLPITRDCWEFSQTFSCQSRKTNECESQKEKGCLQAESTCIEKIGNTCILYEQIYNCQYKVCKAPVACVKDLFCRDGDCTEHASSQSNNFGEAISQLSGAGAAGAEYSQNQTSLFGGKVVQCKIWLWDFIDCCSDKGWGKKLNIAHCPDEDKELGRAKLNYQVHYLGDFCSEKDLGVCIVYKRSYCVFSTKMARIIQEEGRLKQLNPNALGTAEEPTCGGLGVEEFQKIDMSKIDFIHPVYPFLDGVNDEKAGITGDFKPNLPASDKLNDLVNQRIQEKVKKL